MSASTKVVVLRRLPDGPTVASDFAVDEQPIAALADGEVLTRTLFFSLDPVMRKRMLTMGSEHVGQVLGARTVAEVVESRHPGVVAGDLVQGWGGWREFAVEHADTLVRVDAVPGGPSLWLGALGRPGITAWLGIEHVLRTDPADVVIVSSAAGAVGSVAGQLAAARGAHVIGIAGGPAKCGWLIDEAGFDAAVDYRADDFGARLAAAVPDGATAVFEAVGGSILDDALATLRPQGRIALCGLLARYEGAEPYTYRNFHLLLERGLRLQGFGIDSLTSLHPRALEELREAVDAGTIATHETVTPGIERAPEAFVGMLAGHGHGKHLVRVAG